MFQCQLCNHHQTLQTFLLNISKDVGLRPHELFDAYYQSAKLTKSQENVHQMRKNRKQNTLV